MFYCFRYELCINSVFTRLTASKCFQCHSPAPHCTLLIDTSTLLSDTRNHPDDNSDDDIASVSPHFTSSVSNTHQQSSEYDSTSDQDDSLPQVGRKRRRVVDMPTILLLLLFLPHAKIHFINQIKYPQNVHDAIVVNNHI